MVIQILPRDTRNAELAESFGSVGEGLGGTLGLLIGSKISQVRARNAFKGYGLDEKEADTLSRLPMAQRNKMLNNIAERKQFGQQGDQESSYNQQQAPTAPQQPFQMQPQTLPNMAARMIPQALQRQAGITNPLQSAYQASQAPQNYEQALTTGQPQAQLQAAQGGLRDLQRASLSGLLGNPQQPIQQQPQQAQRQPGQAPSLSATGGIAPQLPSETPRTQPRATIDESGIPEQYRGLGLKPYKKPDRNTYAGIMSGPKYGEEDNREKDYYEHQLTAKENASKAEKPKLDKIYKEADFVRNNNLIQKLQDLKEVNDTGQVYGGKPTKILGSTFNVNEETRVAADILKGIPLKYRTELSLELSPEVRADRIDKLLDFSQKSLQKENALNEIIDESNGWIPKNIDKVVEQRLKEPISEGNEVSFAAPKEQQPSSLIQNRYAKGSETNTAAQAVAPAVRVAESAASGFGIGDITQALKSLGGHPSEEQIAAYAKQNKLPLKSAKNPFELPTSSEAREFTKEVTGKTFEPTGYKSQLYQDIGSKAILMFNPYLPGTFSSKAVQALIPATTGVAAREILKGAGVNAAGQAVGELLVSGVASSTQFKDIIKNEADALYKIATPAAEKIAKTGKLVQTTDLRDKINAIWDPVKNSDLDGIKDLQSRVAGLNPVMHKKVPITELIKAKRALGSHWEKIPSAVHKPYREMYHALRDKILNYGVAHPEFGIPYAKAESLQSGLHDAARIKDFVESNKIISGLYRGFTGAIAKLGYEQSRELKTLLQNPEFRNIYGKFYTSAVAGNVASTANNLRKATMIINRNQEKRR